MRQAGFTLIEMVLVLVLVGTLTVLAGRGAADFYDARTLAGANLDLAHTGQLAMARLAMDMSYVSDAFAGSTGSSLQFSLDIPGSGTSGPHTVALDGSNPSRLLYDGNLLADSVSSFSLQYCSDHTTCQATPPADVRMVEISLGLSSQGVTQNYSVRIAPPALLEAP
jgi:prepilin-type N-terminal cleavage/methylation domain-containing protein